MARPDEVRSWFHFLGVHTANDAAAELRRMVMRLNDAYYGVGCVLKLLAGCPGGEVEDVLRVTRTTLDEATGLLDETVSRVRAGDPDAA